MNRVTVDSSILVESKDLPFHMAMATAAIGAYASGKKGFPWEVGPITFTVVGREDGLIRLTVSGDWDLDAPGGEEAFAGNKRGQEKADAAAEELIAARAKAVS